jgi:hypothetical protein
VSEVDGTVLLRLLADDARRRVVAALVLGASTAADVRTATGLPPRQITVALAKLVDAGLVVAGDDGSYLLLAEAFRLAAMKAAPPRPREEPFFRDGRIVSIPVQRTKRLALLDRLAQEFEPGRHYTEKQVDAALRAFHDDHAALRRYLVDEGFLDRSGGEYWRSGGTYRP